MEEELQLEASDTEPVFRSADWQAAVAPGQPVHDAVLQSGLDDKRIAPPQGSNGDQGLEEIGSCDGRRPPVHHDALDLAATGVDEDGNQAVPVGMDDSAVFRKRR